MILGQRVKELRKQNGYSQKQLADLVGAHQTWVSKIEKGIASPSPRRLCVLVDVLHTDPSYLLGMQRRRHQKRKQL